MAKLIKTSRVYVTSNGAYVYHYYEDGSKKKVYLPQRDEVYNV